MSEYLFLFSHCLGTKDDFTDRQPLEDILIHETGILAPAFSGLVEGFITLANFDI